MFIELLTLLFIAFKLLGIISWSWWWVLSPLLIKVGLIVLVALISGLLAIFSSVLD